MPEPTTPFEITAARLLDDAYSAISDLDEVTLSKQAMTVAQCDAFMYLLGAAASTLQAWREHVTQDG